MQNYKYNASYCRNYPVEYYYEIKVDTSAGEVKMTVDKPTYDKIQGGDNDLLQKCVQTYLEAGQGIIRSGKFKIKIIFMYIIRVIQTICNYIFYTDYVCSHEVIYSCLQLVCTQ